MSLVSYVVCSAKRIAQGILDYSPVGENAHIVFKPLLGCSSEIENNFSHAHLIIPMIEGGDSLKVLQPLRVLLVVSGENAWISRKLVRQYR